MKLTLQKNKSIDYGSNNIVMTTKDGIYSLTYYIFYIATLYIFGLLVFKGNLFSSVTVFDSFRANDFLIRFALSLIQVSPIFLIIKLQNRTLDSLGIKWKSMGKGILQGIVYSLPVAIIFIIIGLNKGIASIHMDKLIWLILVQFICIGFVEELVFRSFIQTRIAGLIRNKYISLLVVGILFCLIHIPYQMLQSNLSMWEYITQNGLFLCSTILIHFIFVFIYSRSKNLMAPIIVHTFINCMADIVLYS